MKDRHIKHTSGADYKLPSHLIPISVWLNHRCVNVDDHQTDLSDLFKDYMSFNSHLFDGSENLNATVFKWVLLSLPGVELLKRGGGTPGPQSVYAQNLSLKEGGECKPDSEHRTFSHVCVLDDGVISKDTINTYWDERTEASEHANIKTWQLTEDFNKWCASSVDSNTIKTALKQHVTGYKFNSTLGVCKRKLKIHTRAGYP